MKIQTISNSKILIINILLIFSAHILRGQNPAASSRNLVINPSFEVRTKGYHIVSEIDTVNEFLGWASATSYRSAIYGTSSNSYIIDDTEAKGQRNFKAMTGQYVANLGVCCSEETNHRLNRIIKRYSAINAHYKRSYLEGELKTLLEVGQKYYIGFCLHFHCISTTGMGMAFEFKENIKDTSSRLHLRPVLYQKQLLDYDANRIWTVLVDSFVADRPYKNFYIGNFFSDDSIGTSGSKAFDHYSAFVDDVFVIKSLESKLLPVQPKSIPSLPLPEEEKSNRQMNRRIEFDKLKE